MEVIAYQPRDFEQLQQFLLRQFPLNPQKANERFFHWRFDENPLGSSLSNYYLAWDSGEIIGQVGTLRDRIWAGGNWWDCLWLVDLIVAQEKRGGLAAKRLIQAAMAGQNLVVGVGTGPRVLSLYTRLRWRLLPVASTFFSVGRAAALLDLAQESGESRAANRWRAIVPLVHPGLRLLQRAGCLWSRRHGIDVAPIPCFHKETDELLERLLPRLGVTTYRSARQLEWKFGQRPVGRHVLLAARGPSAELLGYAVVKWMRRGEAKWAEVVDFIADPAKPRVFQALVGESVRQSLDFGADFLRIRCSLAAQTALLRPPFWLRRNRHVIDDLIFFTKDENLARHLIVGPWHLTSLASDRTDHGRDEWY